MSLRASKTEHIYSVFEKLNCTFREDTTREEEFGDRSEWISVELIVHALVRTFRGWIKLTRDWSGLF